MGEIIQLQGDQRQNVKEWLLAQEVVTQQEVDRIVIHGEHAGRHTLTLLSGHPLSLLTPSLLHFLSTSLCPSLQAFSLCTAGCCLPGRLFSHVL